MQQSIVAIIFIKFHRVFPSPNVLLNSFSSNLNAQCVCHARHFVFYQVPKQCVILRFLIYDISDCESKNKVKEQRDTSSRSVIDFF